MYALILLVASLDIFDTTKFNIFKWSIKNIFNNSYNITCDSLEHPIGDSRPEIRCEMNFFGQAPQVFYRLSRHVIEVDQVACCV